MSHDWIRDAGMMGRPQIEPSAGMRTMAHMPREMFISLVNEGFTEAQAMQMCGNVVTTHLLFALSEKEQGDDDK